MAKRTKHESDGGQGGGKALVIVESPAKAKTINRYLGRDYVVKASMGHVRDLPQRGFGVDVDHDFRPDYEVLASRKKVIGELRKLAEHAPEVYLATDLDREGEAIAWHLWQALGLPAERVRRVIFNEITSSAVQQAFAHPRELDLDRVNAQQARRILDRIVGYELSPLLWQKIAKGLSAGRVQSVAVRLVVDREQEIRQFVPEEFWRLTGYLTPALDKAEALGRTWREYLAEHGKDRTRKGDLEWLAAHEGIRAELIEVAGKAFRPASVDEARNVAEALGWRVEKVNRRPHPDYAAKGKEQVELVGRLESGQSAPYVVRSIETKRTLTRPSAPFITATLQQSAATQLYFSTSKTMRTAQTLYEGVDLGEEGPVGLITYMRTDSTNLSAEAVAGCRSFVGDQYGPQYVPEKPNTYKSRTSAQEAHEAVRPTDVNRTPESLKGRLASEQWKLYNLIWQRFVASQMKPAEWDSTVATITARTAAGEATFKAGGRRLVFDGCLRVTGVDTGGEQILPNLAERQGLAALEVEPAQHFTSPPPRYTEASLVKSLEAEGIGRPSTYATIIQTIQDRGYVEQKERKFWATSLGEEVTNKLLVHFPRIMDVKFTSHMEDLLDNIEESHLDWVKVLHEFYDPFKQNLVQAEREMPVSRGERSHKCPECQKPLAFRWSKSGRFLACTGYPDCKYTCNVDHEGNPVARTTTDTPCQRCGKPMVLRSGQGKPFLGCSGYPDCNFTMPCDETGKPLRKVTPEEIHETCDDCGAPMTVKWRGRRPFLGCSSYPDCRGIKPLPADVYIEPPPVEQAGLACPDCGRPMLIRKSRRGPFVACSGFPKCRKAIPIERLEEAKAQAAAADGAADPAVKSPRKAKGGGHGQAEASDSTAEPAGGTKAAISKTRNGKMVVETLDGPVSCPECGSRMQVRAGRWGPFMACSAYPKCKGAARLKGKALEQAKESVPTPAPKPKAEPTDITCPECGSKMMIRMSRRGRFLGCGGYPKCRHTMEMPADLAEQIRKRVEAESKA